MTNRFLAASLLVALTTLPAFAASTMPSTGPAPTGGPVGNTGGEIASPGDPFRPGDQRGGNEPDHAGRSAKRDLPVQVSCVFGETGYMEMTNNSGEIIPAGTVLTWTSSNGETGMVEVKYDWYPGEDRSASVNEVLAGTLCDVTISPVRKTPDPTLICQASISADGTVTVILTNTTGLPIPAGTKLGYDVDPLFHGFNTTDGVIEPGGTYKVTWANKEWAGGRLGCEVFKQKSY